jgi:hypothetical protein
MPNPHPLAVDEDSNDVKAVLLKGLAMAIDPDLSRLRQLLLFPPIDRGYRTAEIVAFPRLDLDEGDRPLPLDNEVDISATIPKAPIDDLPPLPPKPPFRDSLSQLPKCLPGRGHGANVRSGGGPVIIGKMPDGPE